MNSNSSTMNTNLVAKIFATCGVLTVAMVAIVVCVKYDVDPQQCLGTIGLTAIAVYIVWHFGADYNHQNKVALFLLSLFCAGLIVGPEKLKPHLEVVSTMKTIKDFLDSIMGC